MDYVLHVGVVACLYVILATSLNLLIGFAGLFALSHAAFYAVGGYATAILAGQLGVPFPLPLLVGVAAAAVVGVLVALPALRIGSHYLVIVTLALQVIVLAVLLNWKSLTGGPDGISGIPKVEMFGVRLGSAASFLPLAAAMAAACFWVAWRLATSPFGRALKAMRENELAAQAVGKNIVTMKLVVFGFSAALAAVAGALYGHYIGFVSPDSFTVQETVTILAMVILGGTGNLWGSVAGAVLLVLLPEALTFLHMPTDVADKLRQVIYGAMLVLILRVRPQGLLGETSTAPRLEAGSAAPPATTADSAGGRPGEPVLVGRGLVRRFGGIVAANGVDVVLESGRITGLIGPNGAGKTTAFNLLTGFLKPNAGSVALRGREITGLKPHRIVHAGIARSFQDLRLFTRMSALENVLVALPGQAGDSFLRVFFTPWAVRREERENYARAMQVLAFVRLEHKAFESADNLSYAEEKLLVVARLLATGAEVLLFDEPLSGLDPTTLEEIFPVVRRLAEAGKTVCIIEHNLDVIRTLCDRVYFLDEGKVLAEGTPEALIGDPVLAERYFA